MKMRCLYWKRITRPCFQEGCKARLLPRSAPSYYQWVVPVCMQKESCSHACKNSTETFQDEDAETGFKQNRLNGKKQRVVMSWWSTYEAESRTGRIGNSAEWHFRILDTARQYSEKVRLSF